MRYKSEALTFQTLGELSSFPLSVEDQNGILFAVITGEDEFQMAMWFKNSTATVDNVKVFPASGLGRWIVAGASGDSEILTFIGDTIPAGVTTDIKYLIQKRTNGTYDIKARFNGVFESVLSSEVVVYQDTIPAGSPGQNKLAVVNKATGTDELYISDGTSWQLLTIGGYSANTQINFNQLPTGTTANTVAIGNHEHAGMPSLVLSNPVNGEVLKYDNGDWINAPLDPPITAINDLSDVTITTPNTGDVISFNGMGWINQAMASGGGIIQFGVGSYDYLTVPPTLPTRETGKEILIMRYGTYDHPALGWKIERLRYVVYHWFNDEWRPMSFSTPSFNYSSGTPQWVGEAIGQVFINTATVPRTIYMWDGTQWTQLYP